MSKPIRIKLIGWSQSGKTSFCLACLATKESKQRGDRYQIGVEALGDGFDNADVEAFVAGHAPEATQKLSGLTTVELRLTDRRNEGWEQRVKLIDSAGELQLRNRGSGQFEDDEIHREHGDQPFDGLLVLTPQPCEAEGGPEFEADEDARRYAEETASRLVDDLQGSGTGGLPVALLVTKRDRALKREGKLPSRAQLEACEDIDEGFLSSKGWSQIRSTRDALRSKLGSRDFAVFGISTHGPAPEDLIRSGSESLHGPVQDAEKHLCAFGLSGPLGWVAVRALEHREAADSRAQVRAGRRLRRGSIAMVVLTAITWISLAWQSHGEWSRHVAVLEDASTTPANLRESLGYFRTTMQGTDRLRGLLLWPSKGAADAADLHAKAQRRLDDRLWTRVDAAKDDAVRVDAAKDYLRTYGNGDHATDAQAVLDRIEAGRERARLSSEIEMIRDARLAARDDPEELSELADDLRLLEGEVVARDGDDGALTSLFRAEQEAIDVTRGLLLKDDSLRSIGTKISSGDLLGAVTLAASWETGSGASFGALVQEAGTFREQLPRILVSKCSDWIAEARWLDAYGQLENYTNWPKEWKSVELDFLVDDLRLRVEEAHDRAMYQQLKERFDNGHLEYSLAANYLERAPRGYMAASVEAVRDYLLDFPAPRADWSLEVVDLRLAPDALVAGGSPIRLTIELSGAQVIYGEFEVDADGDPAGPLALRGRIEGKLTPAAEVSLHARAVDVDVFFDDPLGRIDQFYALADLDDELVRLDGDGDRAWFLLRLHDPLERPELPAWQK